MRCTIGKRLSLQLWLFGLAFLFLRPGALLARSSQQETGAFQEGGAETRAEELLAERRKRLAEVTPAKRSRLVEVLTTMENDGFDQLVTWQLGHFRLGFGKISPVSGGTPAIQYERPRLGASPLTLRTAGAYSFRGYQAYELQLGVFDELPAREYLGDGFLGAPFDFDNRSQAPLDGHLYSDVLYRNFPREIYYGLGTESLEENRSVFGIDVSSIDLVTGYQVTRWLGFQGRVGFGQPTIREGRDDKLPNTQDLFDESTAPGLESQPDYLRYEAAVYMGWEGDPNRSAAEVGLRAARYEDLDEGRYQFTRASVDLRGHLPLGSRQRTLSARVFASSDFEDGGSVVPFYLMKTLGGHDTLRGYRDFRFRDANVLYLSAEYRWEATAGIELALFYDTGKVFPDTSDFNFEDLKDSFGFGIRGKSLRRVVFRLDLGHSEEGTFVYIAFGPSF